MKIEKLFQWIALGAVVASLASVAPAADSTTTNGVTAIAVSCPVHQYFADRSGTITFTVSVTYKGTIGRLGVKMTAPTATNAKWTFASGTGPTAMPAAGDASPWLFSYATNPASPAVFTVTLNYASGLATPNDGVVDSQTFGVTAYVDNQVAVDATNTPVQATLRLTEAVFHTADTNRDMRIGLSELLRVVQIYNTRNNSVRTGAYDASYNPYPSVTTPVTPSVPHSADIDRDGSINLMELMRAMDLAKYTAAGVRTGEYHADSSGPDGFTTAP